MTKIKNQAFFVGALSLFASIFAHPVLAMPPTGNDVIGICILTQIEPNDLMEIHSMLQNWSGEFNVDLNPKLEAKISTLFEGLNNPNFMGDHSAQTLTTSRNERYTKWENFRSALKNLDSKIVRRTTDPSLKLSSTALNKLAALSGIFVTEIATLNIDFSATYDCMNSGASNIEPPYEARLAILVKVASLIGMQFDFIEKNL